jgi:plasmid stabilization system protein ParE
VIPVVFSPEASEDLDVVWAGLARLSELAATNVTLRIVEACLSLSEFPLRHPVEERASGHESRRFNLDRYAIFYEVREEAVEIIRVLPGEMDLEQILRR